MSAPPTSLTPATDGYADRLTDLKRRIGAAQRAALAVNRELRHLCSRLLHNRRALPGPSRQSCKRCLHNWTPALEHGMRQEVRVTWTRSV